MSSIPSCCCEIDGGIDAQTIGPAREAGCDLFVVGSAIFRQDDYGQAIEGLNEAIVQTSRTEEAPRS